MSKEYIFYKIINKKNKHRLYIDYMLGIIWNMDAKVPYSFRCNNIELQCSKKDWNWYKIINEYNFDSIFSVLFANFYQKRRMRKAYRTYEESFFLLKKEGKKIRFDTKELISKLLNKKVVYYKTFKNHFVAYCEGENIKVKLKDVLNLIK